MDAIDSQQKINPGRFKLSEGVALLESFVSFFGFL
jgi:hypothetical protein